MVRQPTCDVKTSSCRPVWDPHLRCGRGQEDTRPASSNTGNAVRGGRLRRTPRTYAVVVMKKNIDDEMLLNTNACRSTAQTKSKDAERITRPTRIENISEHCPPSSIINGDATLKHALQEGLHYAHVELCIAVVLILSASTATLLNTVLNSRASGIVLQRSSPKAPDTA